MYSNLGPGSDRIGKFVSFYSQFGSFHFCHKLTNSCSTLYLLVHYYKLEIVIFECQRYSWIKEEKLLKVWGASDCEVSSTFLENTGHFSIGTGAEIRPQNSLENLFVKGLLLSHLFSLQYLAAVTCAEFAPPSLLPEHGTVLGSYFSLLKF